MVEHKSDIIYYEAEAAIAILVDYTSRETPNNIYDFDISDLAQQYGLWNLASRVIINLVGDSAWHESWNDPELKKKSLINLYNKINENLARYNN